MVLSHIARPKTKRSKPKVQRPRLHVARAEARKILGGIAERTFARLQAEGVIVPVRRGRGGRVSIYDLAVIVPAYLGYVTTSSAGDDRKARARRDDAQTEWTTLRIARERGELVPRAQVITEGQGVIHAQKARLLAIPRQLVRRGATSNGGEQIAHEVIREALEELSRWPLISENTSASK